MRSGVALYIVRQPFSVVLDRARHESPLLTGICNPTVSVAKSTGSSQPAQVWRKGTQKTRRVESLSKTQKHNKQKQHICVSSELTSALTF